MTVYQICHLDSVGTFIGLAFRITNPYHSVISIIECASYHVAFMVQLLSYMFVVNHPFCNGKNDCSNGDWDYVPEYS